MQPVDFSSGWTARLLREDLADRGSDGVRKGDTGLEKEVVMEARVGRHLLVQSHMT